MAPQVDAGIEGLICLGPPGLLFERKHIPEIGVILSDHQKSRGNSPMHGS
jgi:hypothetical protein